MNHFAFIVACILYTIAFPFVWLYSILSHAKDELFSFPEGIKVFYYRVYRQAPTPDVIERDD